jgi:hypothetical protein
VPAGQRRRLLPLVPHLLLPGKVGHPHMEGTWCGTSEAGGRWGRRRHAAREDEGRLDLFVGGTFSRGGTRAAMGEFFVLF